MKPDTRFLDKDPTFWACVRSLSQTVGYSERGKDKVSAPDVDAIRRAFAKLDLNVLSISDEAGIPTALAIELADYFSCRAAMINNHVFHKLMNHECALKEFEKQAKEFIIEELKVKGSKKKKRFYRHPVYDARVSVPNIKQAEGINGPSLLTGLVNLMILSNSRGARCDYDPQKLVTITQNNVPVRTFARRVDGAFPSSVNPVAIWENKEFYSTTSFGSRVSGAIYETNLDGLEIDELRRYVGVNIKHYIFTDAKDTWWSKGKSYLCRFVDMMHMGLVDEVLFGMEVVEEMPRIVDEWIALAERQERRGAADPAADP